MGDLRGTAIRFGIAGIGRHGARYAEHLRRGDVPGGRLQAVWRRDASAGRAFAEKVSATHCSTFEALVDDADVDAVVLAVPSGLHAALAPRVARAGKPLLIEKPLARNTGDGQRIIDHFETAGVPLTVAQTLRFDPLIHAGGRAAAALGGLVGFGFEQRLEPRGLAWEEDPALAGGGVLAQSAIHAVDALRVLTQPSRIEVVHALLARLHYAANEDLALVQLELTGCPAAPGQRVFGDIRASKIGSSRHHRFALFFERGGLELDFIARQLVQTEGRHRTVSEVPGSPTVPQITAAFVRFIKDGEPNPVAPRDALQSLAVIEAAYGQAGTIR